MLKGGYVLTIVSKKLSSEIGAVGMQPARNKLELALCKCTNVHSVCEIRRPKFSQLLVYENVQAIVKRWLRYHWYTHSSHERRQSSTNKFWKWLRLNSPRLVLKTASI